MKNKIISLFSFFLIILMHMAIAQSPVPNEGEATVRLNHIAMYVNNLEKSTIFYETVLGLKQIPEPFHDGRHTWFTIGAAGQIHLIQGAEANIARNKNDHFCFSVDSIEGFITNLEKLKIAYSDWPGKPNTVTTRVDGIKQIYFQDPDGHWIEINNDKKK